MPKIAIIDKNNTICTEVIDLLADNQDFNVKSITKLNDLQDLIAKKWPDIVVGSSMIISKIKEWNVSASDDWIVYTINTGLIDHFSIPFQFSRFRSRLIAHSAYVHRGQDTEIKLLYGAKFNPGLKQFIHADGTTLALTDMESALLHRLSRAAGRPVAKDILLRDVWGYNSETVTFTLESTLHRLRKRMKNYGKIVKTVPYGYMIAVSDEKKSKKTYKK